MNAVRKRTMLTYTVAEMRNVSDRKAADDFITFLTSPTAKATFTANGVN